MRHVFYVVCYLDFKKRTILELRNPIKVGTETVTTFFKRMAQKIIKQ